MSPKMPSRRLPLSAALTLPVVLLLGCAQTSSTQRATQPAEDSPVAPVPATPISQAPGGAVLRSGAFVTGEHPTRGTVRIRQDRGKRVLELDATFQTSSMGPDLVVGLHRSGDVIGTTEPPAHAIDEGEYVILAPLRSFTGAQTYEIPDSVELADYMSVIIWCRRFNATFGAARLTS